MLVNGQHKAVKEGINEIWLITIQRLEERVDVKFVIPSPLLGGGGGYFSKCCSILFCMAYNIFLKS